MMIFANVSDIIIPEGNVIKIEHNGTVLWQKNASTSSYFYVEDLSGVVNTLSIMKNDASAPDVTVYTSPDQTNWTELGTTSTTALTTTVPANGKLYLKSTSNQWGDSNGYFNYITSSGGFAVGGNIMSLLYSDDFTEKTFEIGVNDDAFYHLFEYSSTLYDASDLIFPNNTVKNCYNGMFLFCDNLTEAPTLPAVTMYDACYQEMFMGCSSLAQTPELPATVLAEYCYFQMFSYCDTLTEAPTLPALNMTPWCYHSMFKNCTSLATTPTLPATVLAEYCYEQMFSGCIALTAAPELPATTLAEGCYKGMFYGCSLITCTPTLPATTIPYYGYLDMFSGCSSLNEVTTYATDISAHQATENWLNNVAASGDFYNNGNADFTVDDPSGIPTGWTEHVPTSANYFYVEDLSGAANTLTISQNGSGAPNIDVYTSDDQETWTFLGTTSTTELTTTVPANSKLYFKAMTDAWGGVADDNTISMSGNFAVGGNIMSLLYDDDFSDKTTLEFGRSFKELLSYNTTLISASDLVLPATTLSLRCYAGMFFGCTALTAPPALPATTLADECYYLMFSRTGITTAPVLPATTLAQGCYGFMFSMSSLATTPVLPATTLERYCYQGIFQNCPNVNSVTTYATDISALNCTYVWLSNVNDTGDLYNLGGATYTADSTSGIPSGWTEHNSI